MLDGALVFNGLLSSLVTSRVTTMSAMFLKCRRFNQPVSHISTFQMLLSLLICSETVIFSTSRYRGLTVSGALFVSI